MNVISDASSTVGCLYLTHRCSIEHNRVSSSYLLMPWRFGVGAVAVARRINSMRGVIKGFGRGSTGKEGAVAFGALARVGDVTSLTHIG